MSVKKYLLLAAVLAALLLTACGAQSAPAASPDPVETPAAAIAPEPEPADEPAVLLLSEVMPKNRATLLDADDAAPDWIELYNCSLAPVDLAGWQLADRETRSGWTLPERTLGAGERLVIFASGKDRREGELHTDFSLSAGETLHLISPRGLEADSLTLPETEADCSLVRGEDGFFTATAWPTPGYENTDEGYELYQAGLVAEGPLVINEVMVANFLNSYKKLVGSGDWVEIKNISDQPVSLSDYFLSDDEDDYLCYRLPAGTLQPGKCRIIKCDKDGGADLPFSLGDSRERLYLSSADRVLDAVSLHDIPLDGSYGRLDGQGGFFYFAKATPGQPNTGGARRISETPAELTPGGCYDGVESVEVALSAAPGAEIRYTLDGTVPGEKSALYEAPLVLTKTTVLRAVAYEPGRLPSRALTQTYFLNENFTLPVVSLVLDNLGDFNRTYSNKIKHHEMPGSVALYEADGSFSIGCGVTLSGATSLRFPKKNLSVRFRGAYGSEWLDYDVFDGGVDRFASLTFRSGQDYYYSIVRDELAENIALQFSDHIVAQRSRYCVLYVNGKYYGLYALKDKVTRQLYASNAGVSKDSVTMESASVKPRDAFYQEVYSFVTKHDMADAANYEIFCQRVDVDSVIDWAILEGYFANLDLLSGNLRYVKSTENDGKWRLVFYDLDSAAHSRGYSYITVFGDREPGQQISTMIRKLVKNPSFRERLFARMQEALQGPLASENVLAELDRLTGQIEPDLPRDFQRWHMSEARYRNEVKHLRAFFTDYDEAAVRAFCRSVPLSDEERQTWFSAWLG